MKQKFSIAMSLAVILAMLLTSLALADNTIADGDGVAPVNDNNMSFGTVCADSTPTQTALVRVNRNGAAGSTNVFKNSSTVTVSVFSTSGAGLSAAMVAPATITLPADWGSLDNNAASDYVSSDVTFVAGAAGSFSGSVVYRGSGVNSSNATINRDDTMNVTATIVDCTPVDNTPPQISYTVNSVFPAAPDGDNGWYVTDAFVDWTITDSESEVTIDDGCEDTLIDFDTAGVTLSCSASSAGGSAGPVEVTIKRDATAPVVTVTPDRDPDYGDWYNQLVSFTVAGEDATSGVADCDADFDYSTPDSETAEVNASCTDNAGNAGNGSYAFMYDGTVPEISFNISPDLPASGWWNIASGAPTTTFNCSDATAGIESCTAPYTFGEGENQGYTGTAKDNAGNTASVDVTDIDVDLTAPSVALVGGPANGASYYFGSVPAAPTCSASDALSGLDGSCSVSGYSAAVGSHTVIASATDKAGNSASASASYTVLAWTLRGFYAPVDMNGVYNTVRNGSTVPLKFEIFAGATELTDVASVKSLTYAQTSCDANASTDEIETTATGGTSLRYDATSGQFIYNWKTPSTPTKCYRVTMTTQDGSSLVAFFKLK